MPPPAERYRGITRLLVRLRLRQLCTVTRALDRRRIASPLTMPGNHIKRTQCAQESNYTMGCKGDCSSSSRVQPAVERR